MANSLIDDMFAEANQYNGNKGGSPRKNGKKIILVFLFLLIILAIIAVVILMGLSGKKEVVSVKTEFITYLKQGSTIKIVDTSTLNQIFEKLKNNSSESNSDITISTNISDIEEITDYKADVNTKYDSNNSRGLMDINLDYLDNDIFNMQVLITGKSLALKSDEIVTRYVGYQYENLLDLVTDSVNNLAIDTEDYDIEESEMSVDDSEDVYSTGEETTISFLESIAELIRSIDYNYIINNLTSEFFNIEMEKYVQVLNNIEDSKFSQKEVTLRRNSGNVNATAYVLTLNEDELIKFSSTLLEELKNDTDLISIFVQAFESTGLGLDDSTIKLFIDQMINYTYELQGDTSKIYTFTIYVSESNVIKMTLETETISFDFDYIINNNSSTSNITILEKNSNSGIKIDFDKVSNDVSEEIGMNVSLIENNEVISRVSGEMLVTGITSQKSMTINVNLSYTDTTNEFGINIATDIEFKNIEVEDLTDDNCLFLDKLNPEERTIVIDSIETRTLEILSDKQKQINLINSNTGSSVIEGQPDSEEDDDAEKKEAAKVKLINAVANEMYIAEQNGQVYTVNDISNLQIENSEVEITVTDDIATVLIDGYTFKINSAFELSE